MAAFSPGRRGGKYNYYRCPNKGGCPHKKHYSAGDLEERVRNALVGTFNEETWEGFVNETTERQIADLRRLHRSDPQETRRALGAKIEAIQGKLSKLVDLYTSDDISREIYQEKRASLLKEEEAIREHMDKVGDLEKALTRIETQRTALLTIPLGHFDQYEQVHPETDSFMMGGTEEERRQKFYREVGLRVKVGDGGLELSLGLCDSGLRS